MCCDAVIRCCPFLQRRRRDGIDRCLHIEGLALLLELEHHASLVFLVITIPKAPCTHIVYT